MANHFDRFNRLDDEIFISRDDDDKRHSRRDNRFCPSCDNHRLRDNNRRCSGDELAFCTTGEGILFGVTIGDTVFIRVKNNPNELTVRFQGLVDGIALFTNGTGLLRIGLKDIITARVN